MHVKQRGISQTWSEGLIHVLCPRPDRRACMCVHVRFWQPLQPFQCRQRHHAQERLELYHTEKLETNIANVHLRALLRDIFLLPLPGIVWNCDVNPDRVKMRFHIWSTTCVCCMLFVYRHRVVECAHVSHASHVHACCFVAVWKGRGVTIWAEKSSADAQLTMGKREVCGANNERKRSFWKCWQRNFIESEKI